MTRLEQEEKPHSGQIGSWVAIMGNLLLHGLFVFPSVAGCLSGRILHYCVV